MTMLNMLLLPLLLVGVEVAPLVSGRPSDPVWPVVCTASTDGFAVFVPHPTDCSLYFECDGELPILMACPEPLFFDPSINVCNWPDQVDCVVQETTTEEVVEETTTEEVVQETTTEEVVEETTTEEVVEETTTEEVVEETTTEEVVEETTTEEVVEETTTEEVVEETTTEEVVEETTTEEVVEETTTEEVVEETTTEEVVEETTTEEVVVEETTTEEVVEETTTEEVVVEETTTEEAVEETTTEEVVEEITTKEVVEEITTEAEEEPVTLYATCDNVLQLYADGELVAQSSDWRQTSSVVLARAPRLLAVDCLDQGVVGGILLSSSSDGLLSDGSWSCSLTPEDGWNQVGFDASAWAAAYEIGRNGEVGPWGKRPSIADEAVWIWSSEASWQGPPKRVFCRKTIS